LEFFYILQFIIDLLLKVILLEIKDISYFIGRTIMFIISIELIYLSWQTLSSTNKFKVYYIISLLIAGLYILFNEYKIVMKEQEGKVNETKQG